MPANKDALSMKIKICIAYMLGFIVIDILCGCGASTNETESSFVALDVDYTTNKDGTYTCWGYNFKYKIEVSGIEGESPVTFVVLTNDTETRFEDVRYSMIRADIIPGIPEFIILGWY